MSRPSFLLRAELFAQREGAHRALDAALRVDEAAHGHVEEAAVGLDLLLLAQRVGHELAHEAGVTVPRLAPRLSRIAWDCSAHGREMLTL